MTRNDTLIWIVLVLAALWWRQRSVGAVTARVIENSAPNPAGEPEWLASYTQWWPGIEVAP